VQRDPSTANRNQLVYIAVVSKHKAACLSLHESTEPILSAIAYGPDPAQNDSASVLGP
jgi:hypothetical protein